MTRELVYGRNAVREALRGRREVLEVWASERAIAALPWLSDGLRVQVHKERELTEAAASQDHQGVVAWAAPYPYTDAWELAAGDRPLPPRRQAQQSRIRGDALPLGSGAQAAGHARAIGVRPLGFALKDDIHRCVNGGH